MRTAIDQEYLKNWFRFLRQTNNLIAGCIFINFILCDKIIITNA